MGYATRYNLTVLPPEFLPQVQEKIEELNQGYDPFETRCKWHEHDEHMQQVSQNIPALLILDGNGEEAGDVWRKAWLNGEQVIDWCVDSTPPEPSKELLIKVNEIEKEFKLKRIQELEAELAKLKQSEQ